MNARKGFKYVEWSEVGARAAQQRKKGSTTLYMFVVHTCSATTPNESKQHSVRVCCPYLLRDVTPNNCVECCFTCFFKVYMFFKFYMFFFGFGFRLAMSNVGWHVTQKFVILVPDPIGFAPWPVLLNPGEPCDICQHTSSRPLFAGFLSHQGTKTMAFPRINCRTTTTIALTATATVTLCFLLSHLLSQVHRRQNQLSDFVETKKYWTLPKSCGSQSSKWEERKKSRAKRGSLCTRGASRKTVTCRGLRVVELVYHHALLRGRWRSRRSRARRAGPREARFVISQDRHIEFV